MIWSSRERLAVVGCGAVSPFGEDWRAIDLARAPEPRASAALGASFADVPALPAAELAVDPRLARMASPGARLSVAAAVKACADAGWSEAGDAGFFLGVGASGGSIEDLTALVAASAEGGAFSAARFGTAGLRAANPLLAFQLMNNFTLCHAAIATGAGGPNLALFSRGARTVGAFVEAMQSIAEGECERALAGGADSGLHPLTASELRREGTRHAPLSEGAAILALARGTCGLAVLEGAAVAPAATGWEAVLAAAGAAAGDAVISAGGAAREGARYPGEALAATPALAAAAALALVASGRAARVVVACGGLDGHFGALLLTKAPAP